MTADHIFTHASLFSGIGAAELAARWMGWLNLFHCEINPFCRCVLRHHFPEETSYEDIKQTDFRQWRGKVGILTGGFPCQPFSTAGRRKGADDDRYLWPEFVRAISEIRPAWVVCENVAGILSMVQPGKISTLGRETNLFGEKVCLRETRSPFVCESVCSDLEALGYSVQPILIPACAVGAPHRRDRVFFIAHSNGDRLRDRGGEPQPFSGCDGTTIPCQARHDGVVANDSDTGSEPSVPQREHGATASHPVADTKQCGCEPLLSRASDNEPGIQPAACACGQQSAADTSVQPRDGQRYGEPTTPNQEPPRPGGACGADGQDFPQRRWDGFPTTQPAVRRGDDGLPFDVDCLSVPYPRWRAEAVKAYGNAIVPQVLYEIFLAIETARNQPDKA